MDWCLSKLTLQHISDKELKCQQSRNAPNESEQTSFSREVKAGSWLLSRENQTLPRSWEKSG